MTRRIASNADQPHAGAQEDDAHIGRRAVSSQASEVSEGLESRDKGKDSVVGKSDGPQAPAGKRKKDGKGRKKRSDASASAGRIARSASSKEARRDVSSEGSSNEGAFSGSAQAESGSSADGFVDARVMRSNEDVDSRLSRDGVSGEGVFTRPKVIDFGARLKERRKANARVVFKRAVIAVLSVAVLLALFWFLLFSPVFLLQESSIRVSGTNNWVPASKITAIAKRQLGTSLFLVSTGDMEKQIGELPGVTSATVNKEFPKGVSIVVNAQRPAAVLKDAKGGLTAVDKEARVLNAVGASVDGIPVINVTSVGKGTDDAAVQQALKVLAVLPESMRQQITKVSASTQDSITTEISSGKYTIVWGDSSQMDLKKAVVDKIINDASKIGDKHQVDVSAPLRPIIK